MFCRSEPSATILLPKAKNDLCALREPLYLSCSCRIMAYAPVVPLWETPPANHSSERSISS